MLASRHNRSYQPNFRTPPARPPSLPHGHAGLDPGRGLGVGGVARVLPVVRRPVGVPLARQRPLRRVVQHQRPPGAAVVSPPGAQAG